MPEGIHSVRKDVSRPRPHGLVHASSLIMVCLLGASCTDERSRPEGHLAIGGEEQTASCAGLAGDTYCGGQSVGTCWCDDYCEGWGDCCADKQAVCDGGARQAHRLQSVRFVDSKALGGPPVFTIMYRFAQDDLGEIEVVCDDNTATTGMSGIKIAAGQRLVLAGGDFYCFRLEALVNDLGDVTGGYTMPSFSGTGSAEAEFDLHRADVTIEMEVQLDRTSLFARRSSDTVEFVLP